MVSMEDAMRALDIGIEKMELVKGMTTVLPLAHNKEDFLHILRTMQNEIEDGLTAIDQLEKGE